MLYDDNAVGWLPFQTAVYRTEKATVFSSVGIGDLECRLSRFGNRTERCGSIGTQSLFLRSL